jgi:hypothetical protein
MSVFRLVPNTSIWWPAAPRADVDHLPRQYTLLSDVMEDDTSSNHAVVAVYIYPEPD